MIGYFTNMNIELNGLDRKKLGLHCHTFGWARSGFEGSLTLLTTCLLLTVVLTYLLLLLLVLAPVSHILPLQVRSPCRINSVPSCFSRLVGNRGCAIFRGRVCRFLSRKHSKHHFSPIENSPSSLKVPVPHARGCDYFCFEVC